MPIIPDSHGGLEMTYGLLGSLTQAAQVQEFVGCDFGMALEIVKAANAYDIEAAAPADNVIYGVDFAARRRVGHGLD